MRKLLVVLLCLGGCTGVDGEHYVGAPGSRAWFATASPDTVAAYFGQRCAAYGFKPGTPEMAQCIENEASNRQHNNALRSIAAAQIMAASQPAPPQRPINCTSTAMGNTLNTNCY